MNSAQLYINEIKRLVDAVEATQGENIEKAATLIADALSGGGYIFTFGTGHSHIMAEEIFYRAGGLVRVCPILEDSLMLHRAAAASSQLERATGLAAVLLDDVDVVKEGGVMLLFSNSGCNTVAVEMAEEARKRGLKTVCITNLTHAARSRSRHPEGRKLCEVCDEDKAAVSRSILYLEQKNYLTREVTSEKGGREGAKPYRAPLTLTESGSRIAQEIADKVDRLLETVSNGVSEEERTVMYAALEQINRNLKDICEENGD